MKMPNFLKLCVLLSLACELQALSAKISITMRTSHQGGKEATCQLPSNPPHIKTFDGKTMEFKGSGTYTLFKTSDNDTNLPGFSIKMNNQKRGGAKNMNPTLEITDPLQKIVIQTNDNMPTKGNNQPLEREVRISSPGFFVNITVVFISEDENPAIKMTIHTTFNLRVSGLCGNNNGIFGDDLETPSGTQAAGPAEFVKSWAEDSAMTNYGK